MKKAVSFLLVLTLILSTVTVGIFASGETDFFITTAQTPREAGKLKFSKKLGTGYKNAPTAPVFYEDTLIVASGTKLYKLSAEDGSVISVCDMLGSVSYSAVSPLVTDGYVFVQLDAGKIQAFSFNSMKSLWVYTDKLGGQSLCPITFDGSFVYTGFWNGEEEDANYVCLSVSDDDPKSETEAKKAKWTFKHKGGFYWSGSAVLGSFVVFGGDDGTDGYTDSSKLFSINKETGKTASALTVSGDIRSSVTYNAQLNSCFVSSKAGYVYKFSVNKSTGALSLLKSYKAAGSVTASPAVYNGKVYIGCQNGASGRFIVLDADTMKEIYHCDMQGYPQATALVGTGYENEGKLYVYMTYNKAPGGITVFEDSEGQTAAKKAELFTPEESQYCISTISAGSDGTLYYKNDSGNIFAVTKKISGFSSFFRALLSLIRSLLSNIKKV